MTLLITKAIVLAIALLTSYIVIYYDYSARGIKEFENESGAGPAIIIACLAWATFYCLTQIQ